MSDKSLIDEGGKEFKEWLIKEQPRFVIYRVDGGLVVEYAGATTDEEMVAKSTEMKERPGTVRIFTRPVIQ